MTTREELIEAGTKAVIAQNYTAQAGAETYALIREDVAAAFDTVEPLIRADALRDAADDWQHGQWTVLTASVKAGSAIGAAQRVTDWLRARAGDDMEPTNGG